MRNRRNTRGKKKIKELLTDKRFFIIAAILIVIIALSVLTIKYRIYQDKKLLAMQKEEIEKQTQEIFKSIKYNTAESNSDRVYTYTAKLSIVGDILCNTDMLNDAKNGDDYYFDNMFADVVNYTKEADYAVGTLETNFTNNDFSGVRKYNSPISFLDSVKKTGIDMVSVAHNHILDYGQAGLNDTIEKIQQQEIAITGIANNNENESKEFTGNIKEINGIKIAFLSYTYGLSNEEELTEEEKAYANIYSVEKVDKDFEYVQDKVDFIIVIMHWGEVNNTAISQWQLDVKDYLVQKGANVILGSHPSVVEPIELIQNESGEDVLIAYSLGNYISSFKYENSDVEMILNITVSKKSDEPKAVIASADYVPVYVLDNGARAENRFELKDMKKLALEYEDDNNGGITRKVYDQVVKKLRWLNELMVK